MPTASTTPIAEIEQVEENERIEEQPTKKRKQTFHRSIKRDYQRQNFYQKTR